MTGMKLDSALLRSSAPYDNDTTGGLATAAACVIDTDPATIAGSGYANLNAAITACISACIDAGRLSAAVATAESAVRRRPHDPDTWRNLATALSADSRDAEAEIAVKSGLAYDAKDPHLWCTLGELRQRAGRFAEARHCYRRARALDPAAPAPWAGLARAQHGLGHTDKAWRTCQAARARGSVDADLEAVEHQLASSSPEDPRYRRHRVLWPALIVVLAALGWGLSAVSSQASAPPASPVAVVSDTASDQVDGDPEGLRISTR
jgi:Flp pilus assembly protein TadD